MVTITWCSYFWPIAVDVKKKGEEMRLGGISTIRIGDGDQEQEGNSGHESSGNREKRVRLKQ